MEVYLDCLPCVLRGALEAAKMATEDEDMQRQIMASAIEILSRYEEHRNAPEIARAFHRIVKQRTGNSDPYARIKQRDMATALRLLPELERLLASKDDRLYWALKAAATGNVLDSAIGLTIDMSRFDEEFEKPFAVCDIDGLREKLKIAKTLLVIGDNTGETVFDGLLLKQFPELKITYAVRDKPILNDATIPEALASGLDRYADIISTGCDVPGVLLEECSDEFLTIFHSADIVIAKGQGNYETLSEPPRDLYNLLKAKCPVIARVLDAELNDFIFKYNEGATARG